MKKKTSGISRKKIAVVGAGVAAIGALGGAAYYLLGPNAKEHQKKALAMHKKGFAVATKMKKEIMTEYKKAKVMSEPVFHKAVDVVAKNYAKQYKMHAKDINAIAAILKSEWKLAKTTSKKAVKVATKKRRV